MSLQIPCPNCGDRPYTEFTFGGESLPVRSPDPEADFARVYLRENIAGVQDERWFHALGCRRWLDLRRDTATNLVVREAGA